MQLGIQQPQQHPKHRTTSPEIGLGWYPPDCSQDGQRVEADHKLRAVKSQSDKCQLQLLRGRREQRRLKRSGSAQAPDPKGQPAPEDVQYEQRLIDQALCRLEPNR